MLYLIGLKENNTTESLPLRTCNTDKLMVQIGDAVLADFKVSTLTNY
jgi:hypothetical protein